MSKTTTLSDDIVLYNILPRLPSKSLLRFRCVCKSWDSFIRNPSFIHLRTLTNYNHTHHFLFLRPCHHDSVFEFSRPQVISTPFNPNNNILTTPLPASVLFTLPDLQFSHSQVQCVNGLLCFHSKTRFSSHANVFTLIANPTTRQVVTLPFDYSMTIAKNFMVSTYFGYDPVGDEFKVLRLVKYDDGSHEFKIFTVGVDTSWRLVTAQTPFALFLISLMQHDFWRHNNRRGICVNGAIYWKNSTTLLIFDVGTEQFREIPAPSGYSYAEENHYPRLFSPDRVEIDGCLCLVGYNRSGLKLWILRDNHGQVWEQKSVLIPYVLPLCRVHTGEILLVPHFLHKTVTGVYYDMDTMSSRNVMVLETPRPLWCREGFLGVDIVYCQESFRLLKKHEH